MASRTFTGRYKDARVKRPTFELLTAIEWYVADYEVAATERPVMLVSVKPETVEAYRVLPLPYRKVAVSTTSIPSMTPLHDRIVALSRALSERAAGRS
jgi:hypothetical protein